MLLYVPAAIVLAIALRKLQVRLQLSAAKHPSLTGHARMARRFAALVPFYEYGEDRFFRADDAPEAVAASRRAGFMRLAGVFDQRYVKSAQMTAEVQDGISDLQFTSRYRVPFQFSRFVREHFKPGVFLASSSGVTVTDLDGNRFYDLTGSYGVNVFGYDFYKECIAAGSERVRDLGPVLGAYHPVTVYNVARLKAISGLDEVSFHMSGTEAVMQAVRLARYHTLRRKLVRFCGAYHGWWGDVQPGVGNPQTARDTYTLKEMDPAALRVLRTRRDIACVLINPLQALHPNGSAPGDSTLVGSERRAHFDRTAYSAWLRELRSVCTARGIVLIFDEVFVGFRLARGGAQEYFGVAADMVTYGKTVAGGLPIGVVCGRRDIMKRFREDRPADICFARGTFNSHPYVMGAMYEFLQRLEQPEVSAIYENLERARAAFERAPARGGAARERGQSFLDLDDHVHATVPVQLDVSILPARSRSGSELGGHRPPDIQPEFHGRRLQRGRRPRGRRGRGHAARRLVVVGAAAHQQVDQASRAQGNDSGALLAFHGIDEFSAQQMKRSLAVQFEVVERVGDDLREPHEARAHVAQEEQVYGAEQQATDA
jgi:glutamate-1-semialdehyde 2,1-aminomutase